MVYCCVPFCKSKSGKKSRCSKNISFHEFPLDSQLAEKWLTLIARKDFGLYDQSGLSVVCSLHFLPEDFVPGLKRKVLKRGSIPTVFPGYPSYMVQKHIKERKRRIKEHPEKHGPKHEQHHVKPDAIPNLNLPITSESIEMEKRKKTSVQLKLAGVTIPHRKCVICGIDNTDHPSQKFFKFPENPAISNKWAEVCSKQWIQATPVHARASSCSVCSVHFADSDFTSAEKNELKPDAVPKPLIALPGESSSDNSIAQNNVQETPSTQKRRKYCYVSGCKNEFGNISKRKFCLFLPPRDGYLFEVWKSVIPAGETEFTRDSLICELHFEKKNIERFCITKSDKGNVVKLERNIPILKPGAVPCIFSKDSNLSTPENSVVNATQSAQDTEKEMEKENTFDKQSTENMLVDKYFSYEELLKNVKLVKKPNQWWSDLATTDFILFARWNKDYIPAKRIVIENNLNIKVFLKGLEVNITAHMEFDSLDDISALLEKVENYELPNYI